MPVFDTPLALTGRNSSVGDCPLGGYQVVKYNIVAYILKFQPSLYLTSSVIEEIHIGKVCIQ